MSTPDAGDGRGLALRTDAARSRILTGVRLGAEERAALERVVLHAAVTVDQARVMTGVDHHGDLADRIGELIAAAGQEPPDPGMAGDDRLSLELARDVFAVLDAHGFRRVEGDAAVGHAVGSLWQAARDYEGRDGSWTYADRTEPARIRILTGVRLGAEERAALERVVLDAAVTVDHARVATGMDHHSDLADRIGELIAAAGQAEERRASP